MMMNRTPRTDDQARARSARRRAGRVPECCVLFIHHADDPVTRHHYETCRRFNPDFPVVPLSQLLPDQCGLPGGVDAGRGPDTRTADDCHRDVDLCVARYLRWSGAVEAARYVIMESDTLVMEDLRDFYTHALWDLPSVGMDLLMEATDEPFDWGAPWRGTANLPPTWRIHLCAVIPFSMVMLSRDAAMAYALMDHPVGVHCETRLPTGLATLGIKTAPHTLGRQTVSWDRDEIEQHLKPRAWRFGQVFHPVKSLL